MRSSLRLRTALFALPSLPASPLLFALPALVAAAALIVAVSSRVANAADAPGSLEGSAAAADSMESPRYRMDPFVVTGERVPLHLDRVPLDVTVVGRERMDAQRSYLLTETLREVPAVDVQRSGNLGKLTNVRLRGADPRHTLVLFDGISLNGPWLGSFDFGDLMDTGVRRVEVLGGPASSLYGSGAVGGVIQILSPAAAGVGPGASALSERGRLRLLAEYGENVTLRQAAQWDGAVGRTPLGFALTRLQSDGVGSRDGYLGWNANAYAEFPVTARDRLRVSGLATHGEKELPYDFMFDFTNTALSPFGSTVQIHDPNNEETDVLIAGSALWTHRLGDAAALEGEISGLGGRIRNDNEMNGGGSTNFQDTDLRNNRGAASLRARVDRGERAHLLVGAEYRGDRVDREDQYYFDGFGDTTAVDESIHARALYGQAHVELGGRLIADAGIRVDDHSEYGSFGLPRVALAYVVPGTGLKVRGGYGRAFTAPSLTDLYYPGYSNTELQPERSTTWEAGLVGVWMGGRVEARAGYHHTDYENLIEGVLQPDFTFVPENVGKAEIEGEEYALRLAPTARSEVSASAAHLIARNETTGMPLAKRPSWRYVVAGQTTPRPGLTLSGAWRWVDSVHDPFNFVDTGGRVLDGDNSGYAALDLGATVGLRKLAPLDLNVRATNVLDREYSEVKGFPVSGRAFTVGLRLTP